MWESITAGFISNLLFLVATVLVAYLVVICLRRKQMYTFFGIGDERKVTIYISHFRVAPGGAADAAGTPRSFSGSGVGFSEMECAHRLAEVFSMPFPGLESQYAILSAFRLSDIRWRVIPSPFDEKQVALDHAAVFIGSPAYNTGSGALQRIQEKVRFSADYSSIEIEGLPPITNTKQGIVARLSCKGVAYFYLAGLSEFGTASAVIFLRKHWKRLSRAYESGSSFYVLCEAKGGDINSVVEVSQNRL